MAERRRRFGLRGLMVAVALAALICAGAVESSGIPARWKDCQAKAASLRRRERFLRRDAAALELHAERHTDPEFAGRCRVDHSVWDGRLTLDRTPIRSLTEAALALQQTAALFARMAARYEQGAARPWSLPPDLSPVDRDAWEFLTTGRGPLSGAFLDAY